MQMHRMHARTQPSPALPAEAAGSDGAPPAGRVAPLDLESIREESLLRGRTIRERMEWIEARRRELWERMALLDPGACAPPAAVSSGDGGAAGEAAFPAILAPRPGAAALSGDPRAHSRAPACEGGGLAEPVRREPTRLDREVRDAELQPEWSGELTEAEREAERQWLRDEVAGMRRAGWSWEELADIGFGRALLADLGFELSAAPGLEDRAGERIVAETDPAC